jgi:hypothetical protein
MSDTYELVGHNFWMKGSALAMQHGFTFSISLRQPSGSYWVAYYLWLENGTPSQLKTLEHSKLSIIARGRQAAPNYVTFPGGMFPKDILDYDPSRANLRYRQMKGAKVVKLMLMAHGKTARTLRFDMLEETPAAEDVAIVMEGMVANYNKGTKKDPQQVLQPGGPWTRPPAEPFSARL